jgi:uncharacterized protein YaiI (UPF0178 family)
MSARYSVAASPAPVARRGAEPFAELVGSGADRPALRYGGDFLVVGHRNIGRGCQQGRRAGRAKLAAAVDLDQKHAGAFVCREFGHLAVIDRLDETGVDQAAFEKGPTPFCDRLVHHIGHHVDARDQPARESEPLGDGVVMHLVFGLFGGVVGLDAIRLDGHAGFLLFLVVFSHLSYAKNVPWQACSHPCFPRLRASNRVPRAGKNAPRIQCRLPELTATRIYVDADACPVKDEIYRVAIRHGLPVSVVAGNFIRVPQDPLIERIAAGSGMDAADDWIAERAGKGDIVITSDIPLASRCVKSGAEVIAPNGKPFTEQSIGMTLAVRNLMTDLRSSGEITGGPKSYSPRDRSAFLSALDQTIRRIQRQRAQQPAPNQD